MEFDLKTTEYFDGKIKQVFAYLTNRCQLRCKQCLYKPLLETKNSDISFDVLGNLLKTLEEFGAYKISFLGGEPTLYNDIFSGKSFVDIVSLCKDIGYEYIRVDTNGQFDESLWKCSDLKLLDEITFSLDGHNEEINDSVRGTGSYKKCVTNIRHALHANYKVQITTCIHKNSCLSVETAIRNIESMISFARDLGVYSINFHPILKVGVARDKWISNTNIEAKLWIEIYKVISENIASGKYYINVRLPMRYLSTDLMTDDDLLQYDYCPLKMGERALIMPDGQIKVCAFTIGTHSCIARYNDKKVLFETLDNERNKLSNKKICCNQAMDNGLVPLCMSYKPNQKELVWNRLIDNKVESWR